MGLALASLSLLFGPEALSQTQAMVGEYSAKMPAPYRPVHAMLLPSGKVMFWDSYANADNAQVWDPATGQISPLAKAGYNIFCTGFAFLPSGSVLVTGGHVVDFQGLVN